jgi:hypothetical protein
MMELLIHVWYRLVGGASRQAALKIASKASKVAVDALSISDTMPTSWAIYDGAWDEPCWYITYSLQQVGHPVELKNSGAVIISKGTGRILYYGSANDEG